MRRRAIVAVLALASTSTGCGPFMGKALGQNRPGDDTYLDVGSIAVDPRTDTAFVAMTLRSSMGEERQLYAVRPDERTARIGSSWRASSSARTRRGEKHPRSSW